MKVPVCTCCTYGNYPNPKYCTMEDVDRRTHQHITSAPFVHVKAGIWWAAEWTGAVSSCGHDDCWPPAGSCCWGVRLHTAASSTEVITVTSLLMQHPHCKIWTKKSLMTSLLWKFNVFQCSVPIRDTEVLSSTSFPQWFLYCTYLLLFAFACWGNWFDGIMDDDCDVLLADFACIHTLCSCTR